MQGQEECEGKHLQHKACEQAWDEAVALTITFKLFNMLLIVQNSFKLQIRDQPPLLMLFICFAPVINHSVDRKIFKLWTRC
jgi:hypothetical protein